MQSQTLKGADVISRLKEELRIVYVELAARDRELNSMSASHSRQMEAWVRYISETALTPSLMIVGERWNRKSRSGFFASMCGQRRRQLWPRKTRLLFFFPTRSLTGSRSMI